MAEQFFNLEAPQVLRLLQLQLNRELEKVAEPIIAKHIAAAHAELSEAIRTRAGGLLIGLIESNVHVYQREHQLVITLNQAMKDSAR